MEDPAKEFDKYVNQYNRWFNASVRQKLEHPLKNVVRAIFSTENLEHYSLHHVFEMYPCFHERSDLNSRQMAAIALASDWKRIGDSLEQKILSGTETDGINLDLASSQVVVTEMYELMKGIYVDETLTKVLKKSSGSNILLQVI